MIKLLIGSSVAIVALYLLMPGSKDAEDSAGSTEKSEWTVVADPYAAGRRTVSTVSTPAVVSTLSTPAVHPVIAHVKTDEEKSQEVKGRVQNVVDQLVRHTPEERKTRHQAVEVALTDALDEVQRAEDSIAHVQNRHDLAVAHHAYETAQSHLESAQAENIGSVVDSVNDAAVGLFENMMNFATNAISSGLHEDASNRDLFGPGSSYMDP